MAGTPLRVLGKRFEVSHYAIHRHGRKHVTPQMRAAILAQARPEAIDLEQLQRSESEGLLAQLVAQRARLQSHSELALEVGNTADAMRVEAGILKNLELVAKLLGQLTTHHTVEHRNVLISPAYLQLRQAIITALKPHPAAARDVSAALHRLESEAATDIKERAARGQPLLLEHDPSEVMQ